MASDLAKYDPDGAAGARATGGAGAVAILVGRHAPHLVIDPFKKGCFSQNAWDFYKPYMEKEFPVVDAPATLRCYFNAVDKCCEELTKTLVSSSSRFSADKNKDTISETFDFHIFHSPFYKIVEKSFARIRRNEEKNDFSEEFGKSWSKEVEREWVGKSREAFLNKVHPALVFSQRIGNMYTPSIYGSLVAFLARALPEEFVEGSSVPNQSVLESSNNSYLDDMSSISNEDSHLDDMQSLHSLPDDTNSRSPTHNSGCGSGMKATLANLPRQTSSKTISMFSYGSGLISSIYAINLYSKPLYKFENTCYSSSTPNSIPSPPKQQKQSPNTPDYNHLFSLSNLVHNCQNLVKMLDSRKKISPEEFIEILKTKTQRPGLYVSPDEKVRKEDMFEDAFYLDEVDSMFRRSYKQNC